MNSLYEAINVYWPLWESTGTRYDLVSSANNLTVVNTPTQVDGPLCYGAGFASASSQYMTAPIGLVGIARDMTIAAWVYFTTKTANLNQIVGDFDNAGLSAGGAMLAYSGTGTDRLQFTIGNGTGSKAVTASTYGAPPTSTWIFVMAGLDAGTLWIDVNLVGTDTFGPGVGTIAISSQGFCLARTSYTAYTYLNGRIAEVGVWHRVLNLAERTWLYNNGLGRTYPWSNPVNRTALFYHDRYPGRRRSRQLGPIS